MIINSSLAEKEAVMDVAKKMCAAARTAPKAHHEDYIYTMIIDGDDLLKVAEKMEEIGKEQGAGFLIRDAGNVRKSECVVLIGVSYNQRGLGKICGLCNREDCKASKEDNAVCVYDSIDLGIALGSAVSLAADNRIDNRIMFSVGKAALELKLFDENVKSIFGIPLSAMGKTPYFDRK